MKFTIGTKVYDINDETLDKELVDYILDRAEVLNQRLNEAMVNLGRLNLDENVFLLLVVFEMMDNEAKQKEEPPIQSEIVSTAEEDEEDMKKQFNEALEKGVEKNVLHYLTKLIQELRLHKKSEPQDELF